MATTLANIARMTTATSGTGTITLGTAVSSFLTFAQAGITDGQTVAYLIEDGNGTGREVGTGVYTSSGTTLSRTPTNSTNSNNAINLSGVAQVAVTALVAQIVNKTGDTLSGALNWMTAVTIASGTSVAIGAAASNYVIISGTATITSFDTIAQGATRFVRATGAFTLTHNSTSLVLPGGANITAATGDWFVAISDGSGNWRVPFYQKATGKAIIPSSFGDITGQAAGLAAAPFGPFTSINSASTTDLSTVSTVGVSIAGTTTITSFGSGGSLFRVGKFAGILTLTHNASSLILPNAGSNITTAAGDRFTAMSDASGNWTVVSYIRADGTALSGAGAAAITGVVDIRTASATVTIPTGATKLKVTLVGGGGAGGSCAIGSLGCCSSTVNVGGPGGAAGALMKYLSGLTPGNTLALTIGAAGAAAAAGLNAGGNGGDTTLASGTQSITTLTASKGFGGQAGLTNGTPGAAGTGTNGDLNITGSPGHVVTNNTNTNIASSVSGVTGFGLGLGAALSSGTSVGVSGTGYGGGGSGGIDGGTSARAGGSGTAGCAIFEWYA